MHLKIHIDIIHKIHYDSKKKEHSVAFDAQNGQKRLNSIIKKQPHQRERGDTPERPSFICVFYISTVTLKTWTGRAKRRFYY